MTNEETLRTPRPSGGVMRSLDWMVDSGSRPHPPQVCASAGRRRVISVSQRRPPLSTVVVHLLGDARQHDARQHDARQRLPRRKDLD